MNTSQLYLAHLIGFAGGEKGAPVLKNVIGADPAANNECADVVPAGKLWRLLSWSVNLVQGATQTPTPNLVILDAAGNEVIGFPLASAAVSASTTTRLAAVSGVALTAGAGAVRNFAPIPSGLLILGGWTIGTVTLNKGANTDYGPPSISVAEYQV